ncbi:hypothetical protein PROFUN_01346 [Planoprotostelium fungivorum]|uniref:Uncharacterized protein n=1 Tax=Planoprotostelium fungivorum TaxID=1890364 RepID=A0A2P6NZT5_9EUKA|nr:hypothetical protein PROFUN_01346 [Planoprotostelium fungivorum]
MLSLSSYWTCDHFGQFLSYNWVSLLRALANFLQYVQGYNNILLMKLAEV